MKKLLFLVSIQVEVVTESFVFFLSMDQINFTTAIPTERVFEQCYSSEITTYLVHPVKGYLKVNNIVLAVANSILAICGSFSNIFVILTYWRARDPNMKRLCNMLVVALACSDLLVTVLIQILYALRKGYYEVHGDYNCILFSILRLAIYYCCGISGITAILVTVERYIAIARPYVYPSLITRTRLKATICIVWAVYLFVICCRLWFLSVFMLNIISGIIVFTFLISTLSMWSHIFILTKRHKQTINTQFFGVQIDMKQYKETYATTYMIIMCITLCSTPILILLTYGSFTVVNFRYLYIFLPWAETLLFFNSFANSVIFTWREKKFRHAFKKILKRNIVAPAM